MRFGIAAAAVVAAYLVKGLTGFGNTLVFSTAMSFFSSTLAITPVEAVLGLPSNVFIAWRERRSFRWRVILPVSVIVVAGCVPGILLLKSASPRLLKVFFGFVVMALGAEMLLRERAGRRRGSRAVLALIGLTAGVMSGLYGVGALLAAYMSRTTEDSASFRGNLCAVFLITDSVRLVLYCLTGVVTGAALLTAAKLLPFMALGLAAGTRLAGRWQEATVKRAIVAGLIFSGLSLVITNLV